MDPIMQKIVKNIPIMTLPPKTIAQITAEAEARDYLWCLGELEDFLIKVQKARGER